MIRFFVVGTPKPQGSKRAVMHPNARHPSVIESAGQALKGWRASVAYAAAAEGQRVDGAVRVSLSFRLKRPKSHYGTGRNADRLKPSAPTEHTLKPDIDKLTRAVLDALSGIVYGDDSAVIEVAVSKRWVDRDENSGCLIEIEERKAGCHVR